LARLCPTCCYRYGRDRWMAVKSAAEFVHSGLGQEEVLQK
jgi:hypothetical protein